uniref:Uncharacterized protein n=1 Tax=Meloidogyne hapla TaxID=6305 RepID=A0A1I8BD80_MELHA
MLLIRLEPILNLQPTYNNNQRQQPTTQSISNTQSYSYCTLAILIEVLKRNKRWQIDGTFACAPTTVEQQLKQLNVIYRSSTKAKKASTICATGATYYGNTGRCNVRR